MYYFFVFVKVLVEILPRSAGYGLAKFIAILQFYISKKDRQDLIYNLSAIMKDKTKIRDTAKKSFINFAYYLVDFFRYSKMDRPFIDKYVTIVGQEHLDKAINYGKGTIVLSAHLGNYEMGGTIFGLRDYDINVVALPHKDTRTNELFDAQRKRVGVKVIPTGVAVKRCYSLLKKGNTVAFLADRDFSGGGIQMDMFSRKAIIPKGPAYFALKTKATILPAFCIRHNKYHYKFYFGEPIFCDSDQFKSVEDLMKHYTKVLEEYISKFPDQWYVFQKYWLDEKP